MAAGNALNIHQSGYVVFDGVDTFFGRTFQAGAGVTITNTSGVAGNTTISAGASVPTSFVTGSGTAVPVASILNDLGSGSIATSGAGNTITTQLTGLTNHAVLVGAGTSTITKLGVGTNGQVLIGATTADPAFATLTSSDSSISFTIGANTLSLQVAGGTTVGKTITGDSGGALSPTAGNWNILGASTAAGSLPVTTSGAVSTLTVNVQKSQAIAATDATKVGLANFDSAAFDVDANGFVQLNGGGIAATSFAIQANTAPGTNPVVPTAAGLVTINGAAVANHSVVLETRSRAANTYNLEVQYSAAAAATDATKSGVAHFNSAQFSVDANGFVSSTASGTDLHAPRFIVSGTDLTHGANYSTIGAAITAAVALGAPQTVFIQPGTYTEDLTLAAGINLCAFQCDAYAEGANSANVTIIGKCTATFAGNCSLSGIKLQTNSDFCLSVTGNSATEINLKGCFIDANNNNAIQYTSSSAGSKIQFYDCKGDIGTTGIAYFTHSAAGNLKIYNGVFQNNGGSSTAATCSGTGGLEIRNMYFNNAITTTGTCAIIISSTEYHGALIHNSTSSSNNIDKSSVDGGTSSAISIGAGAVLTVSSTSISSTNTNAITGSGTLNFGGLTFTNTSSLINTTTQIPFVQSNDAVKITTPGAYPYTTIPQDGVILVDTSVARTIIPLASPTTGQRHRIKDNVGSAGTNNITITPSGKNIDGSASFVINTNWGSADIVYNGTQWNLL